MVGGGWRAGRGLGHGGWLEKASLTVSVCYARCMVTMTTQMAFREVQALPFCYVCSQDFVSTDRQAGPLP